MPAISATSLIRMVSLPFAAISVAAQFRILSTRSRLRRWLGIRRMGDSALAVGGFWIGMKTN
jgi:hypothetical protein